MLPSKSRAQDLDSWRYVGAVAECPVQGVQGRWTGMVGLGQRLSAGAVAQGSTYRERQLELHEQHPKWHSTVMCVGMAALLPGVISMRCMLVICCSPHNSSMPWDHQWPASPISEFRSKTACTPCCYPQPHLSRLLSHGLKSIRDGRPIHTLTPSAVSLRFTHCRRAHPQACCIIVQILVIYDPNGSEAVVNKPSSVSESLILTKSSVGMKQLGGRQSAVAFTVSSDYKKPHPYCRRYCGEVLNKGGHKKQSSDASSPAYAAILGCV